ncbi:2-oxo-tetronate isomerase [Limibacillus sp. MBR-115]|uniref:2-oxo-tetronate isomerase n=1 Tax=Limibacillus sp. MBR-115 TaxID=3156465 RepID=UPI003390856C
MPRFAANLTMLFNERPFLDRFTAAADAGFEAVEFLFPYDHSPQQVADMLHGCGLTQALFNLPPGDWAAGERGIAGLPGREQEFQDSVGLALDYAKALNCKTLHVMSGICPPDADRAHYLETYAGNLRFAAEMLGKEGITVVVESLNSRDVPNYLIPRPADARQVINAAGAGNLGLQFDFYHVQIMGGDLSRSFEANLDLIRHIQIAGVPERHEPTVGEINYGYLFALIDRLGYDGWIGCEYKPRTDTLTGLSWLQQVGAQ